MNSSLEFLVGLLAHSHPAHVAWEDFTGPHESLLRLLQRKGLLAGEPGRHSVPSCPHCGEGVPYRLQRQFVCNRCSSTVDERHFLLWQFHVGEFLQWLAGEWELAGDVRPIDEDLWQLGSRQVQDRPCECFFWRGGILSEPSRKRLLLYRQVLILYGLSRPALPDGIQGPILSLLEALRLNGTLAVVRWDDLLQSQGKVRFDAESGVLWAGDANLGEVPFGSKEYFFLRHLASQLDRFVAYADIKHAVLAQSGSRDGTEEATFCHRLKNRIKEKGWIPKIDLLLATTNKGDGYRLRRHCLAAT